jgi:hypothetical protein
MTQLQIKSVIRQLVENVESLREQQNIVEQTIKNFQSMCVHEYSFYSSDSHHDYERCIYCQKENRI